MSTYLPRRSTFVILWPTRRDVKSLRVLWRRITRIAFFELLTSASLMRSPTMSFSRSRRITSTSGSSTLVSPSRGRPARRESLGDAQRTPRAAARCSASFLDRPMPVPIGSPPRCTVAVNSFSWSGPRSSRRYSGIERKRLRRELLQDRLVVAIALASHVGLHARPEQPLDQLRGDLEAPVEVDGPEHGLERVGEDRRLVATPALLLALAEQHDGRRARARAPRRRARSCSRWPPAASRARPRAVGVARRRPCR